MRIKEVCERTGLTDRAIRLYMDSGLVVPKQEINYMGRRSFIFSEEDVCILEAVATLRRAEFSISDIAQMQVSPDSLSDIVACHRERISEEIVNKQNILSSLNKYDAQTQKNYFDLAAAISSSASQNSIPKEDSGMSLKDIKRIIRKRIPSLISLIFLFFALYSITSMVIRTAFAQLIISSGGGYTMDYHWDMSAQNEHTVMFLSVIVLLGGVVSLIVNLAGGKRYWLIASIALCIIAAVLLLCMPSTYANRFYLFEYLTYRNLFKDLRAYSNISEFIIKSIKFIPIVVSGVMSGVGFFCHKNSDGE